MTTSTSISFATRDRANAIVAEEARLRRRYWREQLGRELDMTKPRLRHTNGMRQGRNGSVFRHETQLRNPRDTHETVAKYLRYVENAGLWHHEEFPLSMPTKEGKYPTVIIDLSSLIDVDRSDYLRAVEDAKLLNLAPKLLATNGDGFKGTDLDSAEKMSASPARPISFKGLGVEDLILPMPKRD